MKSRIFFSAGIWLTLVLTGCLTQNNSENSGVSSQQAPSPLERIQQKVEIHPSQEIYNGPELYNGLDAHTSTEYHPFSEVYGGGKSLGAGELGPVIALCQVGMACYPGDYSSLNECIDDSGNLGNCSFNANAAQQCIQGINNMSCEDLLGPLPAGCSNVYTHC